MKKLLNYLISLLLVFASSNTFSQQPEFYNEIRQFKKQDSINHPPTNAILFIGSSSFTKWKDVHSYFPNHTIINRGFGGSSLPHLIYYFNDVILPYQPKQIIIYCGENDLASSDTVQPVLVLQRFKQLFEMIRSRFNKVNVVFISIKPSPSRAALMHKMEESNKLIKKFLKKKERTAYVNVYHQMLLLDGTPNPSLFIEDNLHINAKGYAIWKKALQPHLLKR
jgi:lysophospholipase L1-like esterase